MHPEGISGRPFAAQGKVVGQEDFSHASPAQLFTDSIVAQRLIDHFTGTRCLSYSIQFRTMLICGATPRVTAASFIIRMRWLSGVTEKCAPLA
jgi:hypothetical protein